LIGIGRPLASIEAVQLLDDELTHPGGLPLPSGGFERALNDPLIEFFIEDYLNYWSSNALFLTVVTHILLIYSLLLVCQGK
jgi:hypothetical protein